MQTINACVILAASGKSKEVQLYSDLRSSSVRILLIVAAATSAIYAQPCKASAELAAERAKPVEPGEDRKARVLRQRDQFPTDYFAHLTYQANQMKQGVYPDSIREEYGKFRKEHPGDPMAETLYANSLVGTKTPDAIPILESVIGESPTYAPALLRLVEIYASTPFRDQSKMASRAEAYWKACPEQLTVFNLVRRSAEPEFAGKAAIRLRERIGGRADASVANSYSTLWSLEFKSTALAAQDPLRERVREDAKRLRGEEPPKDRRILTALQEAYKLLDDSENQKWVADEMAKQAPREGNASGAAISEWHRLNPYKNGYGHAEYEAKWRQQTEAWVQRWPEDARAWQERFQALQRASDAPLEDRVTVAEEWIRVFEKNERRDPSAMSPYFSVAEYYSGANQRYSELPALIEKGLKQDTPSAMAVSRSDLFPSSGGRGAQQKMEVLFQVNSAATIYAKIGNLKRAGELLDKLAAELPAAKPDGDSSQFVTQRYKQLEFEYWRSRSVVAQAQHKPDEYLSAERQGLRANPWNQTPQPWQVSQLRDSWKQIKGSEEGFDDWLGPMATAGTPAAVAVGGPWINKEAPMNEFSLLDAEGRSWGLASLKGKVTLINFWATWCGPCKAELPFVQRLHEKLKGREDLMVITLNTDENPGLIAPFLRANHYSFPVLPAQTYAEKAAVDGIPLNWLVDGKGTVRKERTGFGNESDKDGWADRMIVEMEKLAAGSK